MPTARASERSWVLPGEPLPVRLMNTVWADSGGVHDDFRTPADVDEWLDAVGAERAGARTTADELAAARALRNAARRLAAYRTQDSRTAAVSALTDLPEALSRLNAAAAALPSPCLTLRAGRLEKETADSASPVTATLAVAAEQTIELLGGLPTDNLRACYAPGCVLYFVAAHPRRAWCSVGCGNRARAARHYEKIRAYRGAPGLDG
jgi:predicted RNA-binding Zn ribbon-like protein